MKPLISISICKMMDGTYTVLYGNMCIRGLTKVETTRSSKTNSTICGMVGDTNVLKLIHDESQEVEYLNINPDEL